jgi:Xaa-Pro aminopeptidase
MTNRLTAVKALLESMEVDAAVIVGGTDIRWACGFTGSNALLIVSDSDPVLVTDGRYTTQAWREAADCRVVITSGSLAEAVREHDLLAGLSRVAYQPDVLTVERFAELRGSGEDGTVTWEPAPGLLTKLRASKSEEEVEAIREAQAITEAVFEELPEWLTPGVTEREVAASIIFAHLKRGAERMSFDPIIAFGANASLPHARPGQRVLSNHDVVLVDFGCVVNGYASDMSRTLTIGTPPVGFHEAYDSVRKAQEAAVAVAVSGMSASDLDAVARDRLSKDGYGDAFSHSLGHGIGLDTHEWPRVGRTSTDSLPERCVVTIEPGVYFPDRFGIRIEDMILLGNGEGSGATNLTSATRDLISL